MSLLYNLARMTTATTGTGTITLGSAVSGFLTFTQAGVTDGQTVSYGIADGANSEVGTGVYTASGTTLTRSVTRSTGAGNNTAISLSGAAQVYITARAEDIVNKAGDIMTGGLAIASTGTNTKLTLSKSISGETAQVIGAKDGVTRWLMSLGDNTAESGSNTGSHFRLAGYDDAGTGVITNALFVNRTTGNIQFADGALSIAPTTGSLSRIGGGGIPVQGTNTNDSAAAGYKGEYLSGTSGSVALTTVVIANLTSIALTAGDWDVTFHGQFLMAATTNIKRCYISFGTTSAALNITLGFFNQQLWDATNGIVPGVASQGLVIGPTRVSLSGPQTYYANCLAAFSVSTVTATGLFTARRVR